MNNCEDNSHEPNWSYCGKPDCISCGTPTVERLLRKCNPAFLEYIIPDYIPPVGDRWDPIDAFMDNLTDADKSEAIEQLAEVMEMLLEELENALG